MIPIRMIGVSFLLSFVSACLYGQTPTSSSKPAAAKDAGVLATVGKTEIRVEDAGRLLARVPKDVAAKDMGSIRKQILIRLIQDELRAAYVAPLPCSDKEVAEYKMRLLSMNPKLGDMLKEKNMTLEEFLES